MSMTNVMTHLSRLQTPLAQNSNKNPCAEVQAVDKCARKKETSEYKNNIEM